MLLTAPPGRLALTGGLLGPLCLRGLNQKAANQTVAPGGSVLGKCTSMVVRPVLPLKVQAAISVGAVGPLRSAHEALLRSHWNRCAMTPPRPVAPRRPQRKPPPIRWHF